MRNRNLFIGIISGIIANFLGFLLARRMLTGESSVINLTNVVNQLHDDGLLNKLISLGAFLNLLIFFFFIKTNNDTKAAGVLISTIMIALLTIYLNN
ncbi:MAG: hypothetical protein CND26_04015 [Bacteroidetes bacterium MED-G13]|nr:MAG: hypothetical protein CND26_04015 [Bacteroidetes bacterium MED-G13]